MAMQAGVCNAFDLFKKLNKCMPDLMIGMRGFEPPAQHFLPPKGECEILAT